VGESVWASVRDSVRESVRESIKLSIYGQHEASFYCFYDYMNQVLKLKEQTKKLEGLSLTAQNSGWFLPLKDICFISERHDVCKLKNKKLHCDGGPSVHYPDGFSIWALNGVLVPQWLAETKDTELDPRKIIEIQNAEIRREFIRKVGIERIEYKLSSKTIEQDRVYALIDLTLDKGRTWRYLKMQNPSIGTYHIEGVPMGCKTIQDALNFRNNLSPEQIDDRNGADWYQQGDVILKPTNTTIFKSKPTLLT